MRIGKRNFGRLLLGSVVTQVLGWAEIGPAPVSVFALRKQADVIVVATLKGGSAGTSSRSVARLQILQTLKGEPPSTTLTVGFTASPMMTHWGTSSPEDLRPPSTWVGKTGLWFLKETSLGYDVLPLATGNYMWDVAFLELPSQNIPAPETLIPGLGQTGADQLDQLLLSALLSWYESIGEPDAGDDGRLAGSLYYGATPQEALAAAHALMAAPGKKHHLIGLAMAIGLSSDAALSQLAAEVGSLQSDRWFLDITDTLRDMYHPHGDASIPALQQIVALHSTAPGLDSAVAVALTRIGTRAVLPIMVELLDSRDEEAQLRAVSFLGDYTMFCDANGMPTGQAIEGPFGAETAGHNLKRGNARDLPAADLVSFWKAWWLQNKGKLGF